MVNKNINYNIQGLRGIAFILIFISHSLVIYNNNGFNITTGFGAFGVEIFIVLGGFLAFKYFPSKIDYREYCKRKILRFLPLHFLTLLIAIPLCLPFNSSLFLKILLNISLLQVWIPRNGVYFSLNAVSWYLGVYIFFILLTPFLVRKISNFSHRKLIVSLILIQFIELSLVGLTEYITLDSHWVTYVCPISRVLDFVGGGILFKLSNLKSRIDFNGVSKIGVLLSVLFLICSMNFNNEIFSTALWFLPSLLIVLGVCLNESSKQSLFSKLGDISFELFLFHQLVIRYVKSCFQYLGIDNSIILIIASFLLSVLIARKYNQLTIGCK